MGKRSRDTGNREERNLAALLPGARKISRSGYTGPDIEWRGRHIEAKYRKDEERNLAALLPGARKISRSGYTGPDIEWRGRHIEGPR